MNRDAMAPFDAMYTDSADPWGTTTRWYERRKRALLLAALTKERYATAYEAGCGTGHISAALADRCDALVASDGSRTAIDVASRALEGRAQVSLVVHRLPDDWPARSFDLIVLSEVLVFRRSRFAGSGRRGGEGERGRDGHGDRLQLARPDRRARHDR